MEWDLEGGDFPVKNTVSNPDVSVHASGDFAYTKPGTYFAVVRVTLQRDGDPASLYARVQNIARARVVVV